jgi:ribosomal protein S24E
MEIKLEKDVANKLLNRREMLLDVTYKGSTPSREEIKDEASRKFNLKHENVVIVSIDQIYGTGRSRVLIHEYSGEAAKAIAQKHVLARPNKKEKGAAAAAAPAAGVEAKPEAKKAEEA